MLVGWLTEQALSQGDRIGWDRICAGHQHSATSEYDYSGDINSYVAQLEGGANRLVAILGGTLLLDNWWVPRQDVCGFVTGISNNSISIAMGRSWLSRKPANQQSGPVLPPSSPLGFATPGCPTARPQPRSLPISDITTRRSLEKQARILLGASGVLRSCLRRLSTVRAARSMSSSGSMSHYSAMSGNILLGASFRFARRG